MKTIYKYALTIDEEKPLLIPKGGRFLSLMSQKDTPVVYFIVDPEERKKDKYYFKFIRTGDFLFSREWADMELSWSNIGTLSLFEESYVLHVWMRKGRVED